MSRIEYVDADDRDSLLRGCAFEANTCRALRGRRGQAALRELEAALLALPAPRLAADLFANPATGEVCPLGALAVQRDMNHGASRKEALRAVAATFGDETGWDAVEIAANTLGITKNLAWAIMEQNDECNADLTCEQRHVRMLAWVRSLLAEGAAGERT